MTDTDALPMESIAGPAVPMHTDVTMESDPCPICLVHFHGRDAMPVVLKTQCCGHRFDLDCISRCFVDQPIGSRQCVMCRQDPLPMVNENTGESHPDTFFPDEAFYIACFDGDLDQVERSLAEEVHVDTVMDDDFTALMLVSILGHRDVAERLINAGANLNARTTDGDTPLFIAASMGNTDCVKLLIDAGADLNATCHSSIFGGATPLFIAALRGHTDTVKLLINAGADLNASRTSDGATPLLIATLKDNNDCVKALTEAGAR